MSGKPSLARKSIAAIVIPSFPPRMRRGLMVLLFSGCLAEDKKILFRWRGSEIKGDCMKWTEQRTCDAPDHSNIPLSRCLIMYNQGCWKGSVDIKRWWVWTLRCETFLHILHSNNLYVVTALTLRSHSSRKERQRESKVRGFFSLCNQPGNASSPSISCYNDILFSYMTIVLYWFPDLLSASNLTDRHFRAWLLWSPRCKNAIFS